MATTTTIFPAFLLLLAMAGGVLSISVPTGKNTPITPAKVTPRPIYHKTVPPVAPVVEYSEEHPEPPPLDPSYVPVTYQYINALIAHGNYYVPIRLKMPVYAAPAPQIQQLESNSVSDAPAPIPSKFDKYVNSSKLVKKPLYFAPKPYAALNQIPTKGGYPKKAVAQPSEKHLVYYRGDKRFSY